MAKDRVWGGFSAPNYTQVPDEFFDDLMVDLSEAELRVFLYLMRRTFGFKKSADAISLKQIINGIQTRDGRVLDRGAGLSHTSVKRGLKGLVEKGVIATAKVVSDQGDFETNIYSIVFRGTGTEVSPGRHTEFLPPLQGGQQEFLPVGNGVADGVGTRSASQETVEQQTVEQDRSKLRTANPTNSLADTEYDGARDVLLPYVADIAREFRDTAPVGSTLTRVVRIQQESGLDDDAFIGRLMRARQITKERTGSIRSGEPGQRRQVAYWLKVVEDLAKTG